jgi:predicted AAA+ superfamily ATPase
MRRYCELFIEKDLIQKMVFIGGPRQVGKTTLSKALCHHQFSKSLYLNWDDDKDRHIILNRQWLPDKNLIILDELHI